MNDDVDDVGLSYTCTCIVDYVDGRISDNCTIRCIISPPEKYPKN